MNEEAAGAVIREVLGGIAPEADLDSLDASEPLQEALDLDSMNFLDFVAGIHDRTGINVPERDYPMIATFGGCVTYLCAHAAV